MPDKSHRYEVTVRISKIQGPQGDLFVYTQTFAALFESIDRLATEVVEDLTKRFGDKGYKVVSIKCLDEPQPIGPTA